MSEKRKIRWLRITIVAFVGLLSAGLLAAWYGLSHPEKLKPAAAWLVERHTGRTLEIDGLLDISPSLQPRITAEGVRIGSATKANVTAGISAEFVSFQIDLLKLLQDRVDLLDLVAREVEVAIPGREDAAVQQEPPRDPRYRVVVRQFRLQDITVRAPLPDGPPLVFEITEMTGTQDERNHLALEGQGFLNGYAWGAQGNAGTLQALIARTDIEVDLTIELGGTAVIVAGRLGDLASLSGMDLTLDISGTDARAWGALLGRPEVFAGDAALSATLRSLDSMLAFRANGHIGTFEVAVDGSARDPMNYDGVVGDFAVSGPEIRVIAMMLGFPGALTGPFDIRGSGRRDGAELGLTGLTIHAADAELQLEADFAQFPSTEGATLDLKLSGPNMARFQPWLPKAEFPTAPFDLNASLASETRSVVASLNVSGHTLKAQGTLGDHSGFAGTQLTVDAAGDEFSELTRVAGLDSAIIGRYTGAGKISIAQDKIHATAVTLSTGVFEYEGDLTIGRQDLHFATDAKMDVASLARMAERFGYNNLPDRGVRAEFRLERKQGIWYLGSAAVRGDNMALNIDGRLGDLRGQVGAELTISAQGEALSNLWNFPNTPIFAAPFKVDTVLAGSAEYFRILNLDATLADSQVQGGGTVDLRDDRPLIVFRGRSRELHDTPLLAPPDDSAPEPRGGRILSDARLPLEVLDRVNLDLELEIGDYSGLAGSLRDVDLAAVLKDGKLDIERLRYEERYGSFLVSGFLHREGDNARVSVTAHGENLDLRAFTAPDQPVDTIPRTDADLEFVGIGDSVAAIAASLNGSILLSSTGGKVDIGMIETLGMGLFSQVIDNINPAARKDRFINLDCAVLNARLIDGVFTLDPGFVLRTEKLHSFIRGAADFGTESLDLSIETHPRKGVGVSTGGIVNKYFKIGGTFGEPSLELDPMGAATATGAAVATGGLSILAKGVWNRLRAEDNPCRAFLEASSESE